MVLSERIGLPRSSVSPASTGISIGLFSLAIGSFFSSGLRSAMLDYCRMVRIFLTDSVNMISKDSSRNFTQWRIQCQHVLVCVTRKRNAEVVKGIRLDRKERSQISY